MTDDAPAAKTVVPEDGLKPLDQVTVPDSAHRVFVWTRSGEAVGLADYHAEMQELMLPAHVPERIRREFDLARNLLLYCWFVYDFSSAAMAQAFGAVEAAVRERVKQEGLNLGKRRGLYQLLCFALEQGWLQPTAFRHLRQQGATGEDADERLLHLVKTLPRFRNSFAHGDGPLFTPMDVVFFLGIAHDIIAQVVPATEAPQA